MCSKIRIKKREQKFRQKVALRYIWRFRQNIMLDRTGSILRFCAKQLIMHEIRYDFSMNNACYFVLRQIWKFDKNSGLTWHDWTSKNGWECLPWGKRKSL